MFYVQHLLGIGHLVRATRIAKALAGDGFEVVLAMGGILPEAFDCGGANVVRLPPVKAGVGSFSTLVHPDGTPFGDAAKAHRRDLLITCFDRFAPDILMIEAFPFGRRQMGFELLPLLAHARRQSNPPLIAASVRDILQESRKPERVAETLSAIDRFFDIVLVHGDPKLIRLEESFSAAAHFAAKILYTGIVAPPLLANLAISDDAARYAAIVSVGGGAVGTALLQAAIEARSISKLGSAPWLFLTGPNLPSDARRMLEERAGDGVVLTPFIPDLAGALRRAQLSISQAGYNTVADILVARCRSVLVPYATGGETEQTTRALLLQRMGIAEALHERDLTGPALAEAIDRALAPPLRATLLDLGGAGKTGEILRRRLASRVAIRGAT